MARFELGFKPSVAKGIAARSIALLSDLAPLVRALPTLLLPAALNLSTFALK